MSKVCIALCLFVAVSSVTAKSPFHRLPATTSADKNPSKLKAAPFPFAVCAGAPTDLSVTALLVTPDPPVKGQNINMELQGTVDEQLTSGSNFVVNVLYDGVQIFTETIDMSTATTLPVGPGPVDLKYSVLIPSIAPAGNYVVSLTFNDQTGTEITCIQLTLNL